MYQIEVTRIIFETEDRVEVQKEYDRLTSLEPQIDFEIVER